MSYSYANYLCVLLLGIGLVHSEFCPNSISARIQECVQPVAEYAKILNNNNDQRSDLGSAFSLPNMGGRVFNELCKLIAKFNVCVRDSRISCPRHVTISLIDSSYGYLCNEGYNTFMESAECLMELDRKPAVKKCHDETLSEIEKANTESGIAMAAKLDRMCGALNFFSGCVRSPIKSACGSSAWQVIYRVLKDTTNTLMPACQFTGTSARLQSVHETILEPTQSSSSHRTRAHQERTTSETSTSPEFEIVSYGNNGMLQELRTTSRTEEDAPEIDASDRTELPPSDVSVVTPHTFSTRKAMRKNINSEQLAQEKSSSSLSLIAVLILSLLTILYP